MPTRPATAVVGPRGCDAATRFAHYLAAHQQEKIHELFATKSIWLTPSSTILHGANEVEEFIPKVQAQLAALGPIEEIPISILGGNGDCFVELAIRTSKQDKFVLTAIHHMTLDGSGKIIQLISYIRPNLPFPK